MRKDLTHEVTPTHYDLFVDAKEESFSGAVKMHLKANESVKSFRFNSKELKLESLTVKVNDETIKSTFTEENEFVTVSLEKEIKGNFTLSIPYSGNYSTSMEGFYKSKYNENNLFSTHFEATDARRAFPCFDQPDMKATFSISIQVPEGYMALSNNEVEKQTENFYSFKKTPLMSTYIVAYVIGKLDYIEDNSFIPIRVYADKSETQWGKFSLEVAVRCLKFFEEYFKIKYPLPKLDMVAIPSFAMGAMENWGLVTYRKTSLLFDETSTSIRSKKNIANTVCHELAHMWFGNLVTMKWWDDLWLNEGFATWAATLAISKSIQDILPIDAWTGFVNDEMNTGMEMDSIKSTHEIGKDVHDPAEIDQIFDAISYDKGSSVIRMLESWLKPEVFRDGLAYYLNKFKYSNAETHNLWDALTHVSNKMQPEREINVASVIDPWIKRAGFPYIKVEDLKTSLKLSQERFTIGYELKDEPWPVPIDIFWKGETTNVQHILITDSSLKIDKESSIYKLNYNGSGFYRVLYTVEHFKKLLEQKMSPTDKLSLFSDAFEFSKADLLSLQDSLSLIDLLKGENNFDVLSSVLTQLAFFRDIFYRDEKKFNFFNKKITEIVSERFGSINLREFSEDINKAMADSLIINNSITVNYKQAIESFNKSNVADLNPEYMRAYYISQVDNKFNEIFELYRTSKKPGEKQHAMVALAKSKIEENIDFIFNNLKEFESHDTIYIFASLGTNLKFRSKIVNLFISKFDEIKEHIGNSTIIRHAITYIISGYIDSEGSNVVADFLKKLSSDPEMDSAVKKCYDYQVIARNLTSKYANVNFE